MQMGATAHVTVALGNSRRQRVEVQAFEKESLALQLVEARVAGNNTPRQKIPKLRFCQEKPVTGVIGNENS